ncbi:MAG: HD-GYP domain-containing protein [Blastocatellia bacterium]
MFGKDSDTGRQGSGQDLEAQLLQIARETDEIEGYRAPHAVFMADLAMQLGRALELRDSDLTALRQAALAHDLGERVMKREYLERSGGLTLEEELDLWRHPILGEQAAAQRGLSRQAQLLIRWHHEWWNGSGYPDALSGEAIPIGARILRLVDTYSALLNDRPWRVRVQEYNGLSVARIAQQLIADYAGIEFDPRVTHVFLTMVSRQPAPSIVETKLPAPPAIPVEDPAQFEAPVYNSL